MGMFQHVVFAKINAPEVLRKELNRSSWKRELVNLGTVTDPYQPAERKYRLTRRMLKTFQDGRTPVVISTKSRHIVDDLPLLKEFASSLFLNVVFSVTTMDETLKRKLEPSTCSVKVRFKAIEKVAAAGITVGVVMSPVFPYLTDSHQTMAEVVRAAADSGVSYFLADSLNLRRSARVYFMPYLKDAFPELAPRYEELYRSDYVPRERLKEIKRMQLELAASYGVDKYELMRYEPQANTGI
jgi:DNA repair photolyase